MNADKSHLLVTNHVDDISVNVGREVIKCETYKRYDIIRYMVYRRYDIFDMIYKIYDI